MTEIPTQPTTNRSLQQTRIATRPGGRGSYLLQFLLEQGSCVFEAIEMAGSSSAIAGAWRSKLADSEQELVQEVLSGSSLEELWPTKTEPLEGFIEPSAGNRATRLGDSFMAAASKKREGSGAWRKPSRSLRCPLRAACDGRTSAARRGAAPRCARVTSPGLRWTGASDHACVAAAAVFLLSAGLMRSAT